MLKANMIQIALDSEKKHLDQQRERSTQKKARLRKRFKLIQELEFQSGVELVKDETDFRYMCALEVDTSAKRTAIREIVGSFAEPRKDLAYDYDTTGEIVINLSPKPESPYESLTFCYRRKLEEGSKCKVTRTPRVVSEGYNVLTCDVDK